MVLYSAVNKRDLLEMKEKFGGKRKLRPSGSDLFVRFSWAIRVAQFFVALFPRLFVHVLYRVSWVFSGPVGAGMRYILLRRSGAYIGKSVYVASHVVVKNHDRLTIGDRVSIHEFSYLDADGGISIGSNVAIAHGVSFVSFEHGWSDSEVPIKYNPTTRRPIIVEDDVWVGCGVKILGGAHIQRRVVIGAGSIVKGNLESGFLYAGVPARKIRELK